MKKIGVLLLVAVILLAPLGAKTALVLGGGGARGLAHIAVLEGLEAEGIAIDLVVGTSMGALVGSLYSAGYTPKEIRTLITQTDLLGLFLQSPTASNRGQGRAFYTPFEPTFTLDFSAQGVDRVPAILGDQRILELLGFLLAKHPAPLDFDALPIPFRAVSTDAVTAERVVHEDGSLVQAVRSSISIPMVFAPFPSGDGRLLLDGGLVDNLPIDLAFELGATTVIASDVNTELLDDLSELESFSAIAMQSMSLATYTKAVAQHDRADLLYVTPLKDINAMDFAHWQEIIERGEEQVALLSDELSALAARLAEERPLVVADPNRTGVYAELPDPRITDIVVYDLSTIQSKRPLQADMFSSFIGRRVDAQTDLELKQRLREVRVTKGLSSLSYEMGEDGTLILLQRGYGASQGQVTMGFSSDVGFSSGRAGWDSWIQSDAYLRASIDELWGSVFRFEVYGQLGTKSEVRVTLAYPHTLHAWGQAGIDLSAGYQVGGLSPRSKWNLVAQNAVLDRIFATSIGGAFSVGNSLYVRFETQYEYAYLHPSVYSANQVNHIAAVASLHYNTMVGRFSAQGIHADLLHAIGYAKELTWQSRVYFMQKIALGPQDSLSYGAQVSMLRGPYQLSSSYHDLGGLDGIPGYGPGKLSRDSALATVAWQHRWFEILGYPTYLQLTVRGGIFDGYNPYTSSSGGSMEPFSDLGWDVGGGISFGLGAPIGEVILTLGASIQGSVAVIFGVY
ncbi:MAG TPA: patatin-like phospholipase family protein [Sphaerochaeta sp.]|nr:patatin-like phospholipase family protein [Sphaerochaeta sp.]